MLEIMKTNGEIVLDVLSVELHGGPKNNLALIHFMDGTTDLIEQTTIRWVTMSNRRRK